MPLEMVVLKLSLRVRVRGGAVGGCDTTPWRTSSSSSNSEMSASGGSISPTAAPANMAPCKNVYSLFVLQVSIVSVSIILSYSTRPVSGKIYSVTIEKNFIKN